MIGSRMASHMRGQGYAVIRLLHNSVCKNHGPRSFSTVEVPDAEQIKERPLGSFRTNIHSPSQQTTDQLGQWYTLEPEKLKKYFTHGGLPRKFMEMGPIFNETAIMVRQPALNVIEYIRKADYTLPPIKYLLYGPNGVGKSLCIAHLVHYFGDEGWVLIHVPWAPNWSRRFKEITPSSTVPGRYDHTIDAAVWLQHFRSQNLETLKSLQLKTTETYNWSRREITEAGSSLLEVVEQGISRARFASDCTMAIVTELKKYATERKCKLAVVIDGVNCLYYKESRYQREDKVIVPPQDFTLFQAFTQLLNTPWGNGCIVGSLDTLATVGRQRESYLPRYLLGKEMSPLPATCGRWTEQITMRGGFKGMVYSHHRTPVEGQALRTAERNGNCRSCYASCSVGLSTKNSLLSRNIIPDNHKGQYCWQVFPSTVKGRQRNQQRNFCSDMSGYFDKKDSITAPKGLGTQFKKDEVHRFMVDCMVAVGTPKRHATCLADVLLAADYRGHYSHGLNRLEMYVRDGHTKIMAGDADPVIEKESVSTALVNGMNGLGPVVGNYAMDMAISKAKNTGIGWVCARGSNHYGIAGWYAMRASKQGLLGMSFTNTSPLVAPTRSKEAILGTNPISLAAPAKEGGYVLDMATCVVAVGKIEVQRRKEEPIPQGWAIDKKGQMTTNAAEGMNGALMPLGGPEVQSGYKGYGLGMLVEIFCGILSGAHYGPNVRRWMDTSREADLGQCFVAIDPSFFAPGFENRMSDLMEHCRNLEPSDPEKPVLVHGDPERSHMEKVDKQGYIEYHINQIKDSWKLAQVLNVKPMKSL